MLRYRVCYSAKRNYARTSVGPQHRYERSTGVGERAHLGSKDRCRLQRIKDHVCQRGIADDEVEYGDAREPLRPEEFHLSIERERVVVY